MIFKVHMSSGKVAVVSGYQLTLMDLTMQIRAAEEAGNRFMLLEKSDEGMDLALRIDRIEMIEAVEDE